MSLRADLAAHLRETNGIKPDLDRMLARQAFEDARRLALWSVLGFWVYACMCVGLTAGLLPW